jgi:hypothetical protein
VLITRDTLSFALVNEVDEVDYIPLAEVTCVDEMLEASQLEAEESDRRTDRRHSSLISPFQFGRGDSTATADHADDRDASRDRGRSSRLLGNAFQIATVRDGYNSGRSYYLQAESAAAKHDIIAQLKTLALSARQRAEVKSSFRRCTLGTTMMSQRARPQQHVAHPLAP